jgi:hypothetical protein
MAHQSYMDLNPGEEILNVYHRHFISYFPVLLSTILVLGASFFAETWLTLNAGLFGSFLPAATLTAVIMAVDLLMIVVAIVAYFIFRQNRVVLTNQHLLQITQAGLFHRILSKFSLDELQDVKGTRSGILATALDYGEILIETAGENENFLFRPVGNPLEVAETINDAHEVFEREHTFIR